MQVSVATYEGRRKTPRGFSAGHGEVSHYDPPMRLRSERLTWREIDGEIIALDLHSSSYFTANSTASALLKRLSEGPVVPGDLVKELVERFEVEASVAEADVAAFLADLEAQGLLES